MDINQLKTLIHVAELGSLSRTADRLNVAQPALSRQIRMLEQELGVSLFERHGRGMVITENGREVLEQASRIMDALDEIRISTSGKGRSLRGMITVGTTPTVAEFVTVPLMRRVQEAHPELNVRLLSAFSGHLTDWLQRGELDLALSYDPQHVPSLRIVPIMIENLLFVTAGEAGLSVENPVPFSALEAHELILPSPRHGSRRIMEDCAQKAGIILNSRIEADSFGAMTALVQAGFGATVLPLPPIYHLVSQGVLSVAPLVDPIPTRKLVLAYPADRPVSAAARYVGDTFVDIVRDLVSEGLWSGNMVESDR